MSTVFDVTGVEVDGDVSSLYTTSGIETINIALDEDVIDVVEVQVEAEVETVSVQVPGLQGPAGDQMVYAQTTNPAIQYNWGVEDKGKIWIEVDI